MQLSAYSNHRVLKLVRTIADLAGDMNIVLNTWPRPCIAAEI
jgi:predicted ATPase with chaperone activity